MVYFLDGYFKPKGKGGIPEAGDRKLKAQGKRIKDKG